jgi:hypothetical protein
MQESVFLFCLSIFNIRFFICLEKSVFVPVVHDSIGSLFLAVVMITTIQSMMPSL